VCWVENSDSGAPGYKVKDFFCVRSDLIDLKIDYNLAVFYSPSNNFINTKIFL
jgi:hypothetical protein